MNKIISFSLLAAFFLLSTGCGTTMDRQHPTLSEELKKVDTVVIAPPRVEIELRTLTGENERITEMEDAIRTELITMATTELEEHGYEVVDFDFDKKLAEDEEFAYTVTQIREGFDQAKIDLQLGKGLMKSETTQIQTSVGEAVNIVSDESGADAILLMRFIGYQKSDGHMARDTGASILVAALTLGSVVVVPSYSGAMTEVALVDGTTGDVLWADVRGGVLGASITDVAMDSMPHDVDPVIEEIFADVDNVDIEQDIDPATAGETEEMASADIEEPIQDEIAEPATEFSAQE